MAVSVRYTAGLTITRTTDTLSAGGGTETLDNPNRKTLGGSTTPPVTAADVAAAAMTAGAGTIDLTALATTGGAVLDLTGLTPRVVKIKAPAANAGPVTVAKGAANGFTGFGAAFSVTLPPGAEQSYDDGGAGTVAVDATHR